MNDVSPDKCSASAGTFSLGDDFPQATRESWVAAVELALKGADFEKRMVSRTYDELRIEPLYKRRTDAAPLAKESGGRWRIVQRADHTDPQVANAQMLADLEGGADSLSLIFEGARSARGFGLSAEVASLEKALAGVDLSLIHVRLDGGHRGLTAATSLFEIAAKRGMSTSALSVDLAIDPIGVLSDTGFLSKPWRDTVMRVTTEWRKSVTENGNVRLFLADGRYAHEAGASEAQELAVVLSTGVSYLKAVQEAGLSPALARKALSFMLVADADEFLTIAKFRALRRLWARIEGACGLEPKPLRLHGETAWRMMSKTDSWVNILRTTLASFSAAVGGADAVCALPFTEAIGLPDAFARRISRNLQLILLDESNLGRVSDPAAGAGGFEALTDELATKAWTLFQEIEGEGGLVESLKKGAIQGRIAAVRAKRDKAVAFRKEPLLGTSEFPAIHEAPVTVLAHANSEAALPPPPAPALSVAPLPSIRLSEPFERLRRISDNHFSEKGTRPTIFLANLGSIAAFTGRATFAKNFFEAGGIETLSNDGFVNGAEAAEVYKTSGAKLACICSSDDVYEQEAMKAVTALRAAGCEHIYFAGKGGDLAPMLQQAGVKTFIHIGCDALTILDQALQAALS